MILKRKWKFWYCGALVLVLLLGLCRPSTDFILNNGGNVRMRPPAFWRALFPEASCSISYKGKNGQIGTVVLWQSAFDGPVTVFSSSDTNVLLCLYDYDVDFRLFRIDTARPFQSDPTNTVLNSILFTSSWEITDGTEDDWRETLNYLAHTTRSHFSRGSICVGTRFGQTPSSILKRLEYQGRKE